MRFVKVEGSNYEIGLILGKKFSDAIKYRLKQYKINKELVKKRKKYLTELHKLCDKVYPNYIKEIEGMAKGADVSYFEILLLNILGVLELNRCSSIVMNTKEKVLIAHDEDGDKFERKEDFAIIKYEKKNFSFYSFFYPGEILGSTFSWNSYGLITTINTIRSKFSSAIKIPRVFVARAILEAKNPKEASEIIKKAKSTGGFHYFIMKNRNVFSVEQYHEYVSVKEIKEKYCHTNHYLHEKFRTKRKGTKNSHIRLTRMNQLVKDEKEILDIMFDRENKPDTLYNKSKDYNQTMATFLAYPLQNKAFVYPNDSKKGVKEFRIVG